MVSTHVYYIESEDAGLVTCGDFKVGIGFDVSAHVCGSISISKELWILELLHS